MDQVLSLAYATGCENRKLFRDYPFMKNPLLVLAVGASLGQCHRNRS